MKCIYHPDREAVGACVNCGRMVCEECKTVLVDKIYCPSCANEIFAAGPVAGNVSPKSRLATTLLCVLPGYFVGIAGIHRFYLGKIGTGIVMLLTIGGLGIWTLVDFIFAVSGNMKDKEGKVISKW